jgi:hypothetical protein
VAGLADGVIKKGGFEFDFILNVKPAKFWATAFGSSGLGYN